VEGEAMIERVKRVWQLAMNEFYATERVNSERCLQAVLYHLFTTSGLGPDETVLVEPASDLPGVPDLVIRDDTQIKCIIEIKCTPHEPKSPATIKKDLRNLVSYSRQAGRRVRLDIFGPRYHWKRGRGWTPPMPSFLLSERACYVFAILARHDDPASNINRLREWLPELAGVPNFVLVAGLAWPEAEGDQPKYTLHCEPDSQR
jgi:hypothetical protein